MTLDLEMAIPTPVPTAENPFALGWRYTGRSGGDDWRVPLTETDLVFPQEGDFVVNNLAHEDNRQYLASALRQRIEGRPGFQRLLAEVAMDRAGLILGLEMSRLARSCKDWHQLLELCGRYRVLLADAEGVYDPTDHSDRLLLGLRSSAT